MRCLRPALGRRLSAVLAGLLAISACGADGNDLRSAPTRQAAPPTGDVIEVIALDNIFRSDSVTIDAGDTVMWSNRGQNDHDVLPVEGAGWGVEIEAFGPGAEYSHTFTEPGTYPYYCSIHGTTTFGMIGTITVQG